MNVGIARGGSSGNRRLPVRAKTNRLRKCVVDGGVARPRAFLQRNPTHRSPGGAVHRPSDLIPPLKSGDVKG